MPSRFMLANAIRALSMDAVQKANSGHPGMPMGMADIAEVLWNDFLKHNPRNPNWPNRDRFILSNGHGSMLQYSLLHLTGYDLTLEDLKQFRQLNSKTPGHPEMGDTPGVETTTGPLGQGFANAVGMALAESLLASEFNRPNFNLVDHYTYCFVGDGCLMEGISHEAASMAGFLGLGKLIVFWDDNGISIDGFVSGWFAEDIPKRFEAYGFQVIPHVDGHNPEQISEAIKKAQDCKDKPSLICCKTTIGFGAPHFSGNAKAHGQPLGEEEIAATRKQLDWNYPPFVIPKEIYDAYDATQKGEALETHWNNLLQEYRQVHTAAYQELDRRLAKKLPAAFNEKMQNFILTMEQAKEAMATRRASQKTLEILAPLLPELLGGSADLSESCLTLTRYAKPVSPHHLQGNYIYYGVREFGMFAIMNGIALHGGFIPFGGTFLTFLDYGRNAVRLAALMKIKVIFVFTHDSIGLGEDGPTHQPIEHLVMLRATPNLSLWRPCDATETAVAWTKALEHQGPTCLALSRQPLSHQIRTTEQVKCIARGGYVLVDCQETPKALIIATGSEVAVAVNAQKILAELSIPTRVISMPSTDVFAKQDLEYRESVLPSSIRARVAIEAAASLSWYPYVGSEGAIIGVDHFGKSAKAKDVFEDFGITPAHVVQAVKKVLAKCSRKEHTI